MHFQQCIVDIRRSPRNTDPRRCRSAGTEYQTYSMERSEAVPDCHTLRDRVGDNCHVFCG